MPSPGVTAIFAQAGYLVQPYTTRPVAVDKNETKTKTKTKVSFVRGVIKVEVTSPGAVPVGKIKLKLGQFKGRAKLKKGKAKVALPRNIAPGTYTLKVSFLGSTGFDSSKSKRITITVH